MEGHRGVLLGMAVSSVEARDSIPCRVHPHQTRLRPRPAVDLGEEQIAPRFRLILDRADFVHELGVPLEVLRRRREADVGVAQHLDELVDGEAGRGLPGEQDLAFVNDTGNAILIQSWSEGDEAFVNIYGTPDGRSATLTGPFFIQNAPADLRINGRPIKYNEIAWYQDVRLPDGSSRRDVVYSRYRGMPMSLGKKYAAMPLTMLQ